MMEKAHIVAVSVEYRLVPKSRTKRVAGVASVAREELRDGG
jgi:hypothetical protein